MATDDKKKSKAKPTPRKNAAHLKLVDGEKTVPTSTSKPASATSKPKAGTKKTKYDAAASNKSSGRGWREIFPILFIVAIIVVAVVALYDPTKELYLAYREGQKLELELEMRQEINVEREQAVQNLQTQEGIEDEARETLGFVREGEEAGVIVGLTDETSTVTGTPDSSDLEVELPQTWWTTLLDMIFGIQPEVDG